MNEACSLIRTAAENDDVQINFGIVLDEALDDEVKITVLATGFQRAGMPALRPSHTSDQVLERATDPRHFSAVSETPIPTSRFDEPDGETREQTAEGAPEDDLAAVSAAGVLQTDRRRAQHPRTLRTISICRHSCAGNAGYFNSVTGKQCKLILHLSNAPSA